MKPSIPKGTRDFLPREVRQRQYIFKVIQEIYESYGYDPIETPAMESLTTLTGKYGEEGDRLLFKILNNGDYLKKADEEALQERNSQKLVRSISKRGLRYDLTVPFARYVVMHRNELTMPFKRYQIQPVWRADRPQKGRYQEFYQCDADAIGSDSLLLEAEYVQIIDRVFSRLGLDVEILLNSRKLLAGIAEVAGVPDRLIPMTVAVDKLAKIGWDGVERELEKMEFSAISISAIVRLFSLPFADLGSALVSSEIGQEGIRELEEVCAYLPEGVKERSLKLDPTLARGLTYYTGCIFEVRSNEVEMGSLLGGGRYADLTGVFGMPGLSGVGISFGVDRIYDVLAELDRFPGAQLKSADLIILPVSEDSRLESFTFAERLRNAGIQCLVYPEVAKMKKQMKYADAMGFNKVVLIGMNESGADYILKDMSTGNQSTMSADDILSSVQKSSSHSQ